MTALKEMVSIVKEDQYEDGDLDIITSYYDKETNSMYTKYSDGTEDWNNFNTNTINRKTPDGKEIIIEYGKSTNVHHKTVDVNGNISDECWVDYDKSGNVIHVKRVNDEYWNEYDEYGRLIYQKHSDGSELHLEYDDNGNIVHMI